MNLNIVFLNCTQSYGHKFSACNTKVEFLCKGLMECGVTCTIHNGIYGEPDVQKIETHYVQSVGTVVDFPQKGNWIKNVLRNYIPLLRSLKELKVKNAQNIVVLEAPLLPVYLMEVLASRITGYKIVVISHEWLSTFDNKGAVKGWFHKAYSKIFGVFADGILPISEYIIDRIQKFDKPYLKIPITADFSKIPERKVSGQYFLYCVFAEYFRVIKMVIDGFLRFHDTSQDYQLILVLTGSDKSIERVTDYIQEKHCEDHVLIKHKLPYVELQKLYTNAMGLIVALNPDYEQDKARFSQKIAEYLSSGTPIISNDVGEIKTYFKNRNNIILDDYTEDGFYRSFKWISENEQEASIIGRNGYILGKEKFDYRYIGTQLSEFLLRL